MPEITFDSPELRSKALAIRVYFCSLKGTEITVDSPELRSKALAIRVYFCLMKGMKSPEIAQELQIDCNAARYQAKWVEEKMRDQLPDLM